MKSAFTSLRVKLFAIVILCGMVSLAIFAPAQDAQQATYATPADAAKALFEAASASGESALLAVLGQESAKLVSSGDEVQDKITRERFMERFEQMNRWGLEKDGSMVLYIGSENWPFPIPLKRTANSRWYFDTKAGSQEILFRRIGNNELASIRVCEALAVAQQDYFSQLHDGDKIHQYARTFASSEGKHNGLYWSADANGPQSPAGPLVAYASGEGYSPEPSAAQPYHGYFFRILSAQGASAPGGARNYVVNGKMTEGFAVLAYPSEYRSSGVMTFLMAKDGVVYQKDLGPDTSRLASQIKEYNVDKSWQKVQADTEAASE